MYDIKYPIPFCTEKCTGNTVCKWNNKMTCASSNEIYQPGHQFTTWKHVGTYGTTIGECTTTFIDIDFHLQGLVLQNWVLSQENWSPGILQTAKTQTSLHIHTVWSAPLLFAFLRVLNLALLWAKF